MCGLGHPVPEEEKAVVVSLVPAAPCSIPGVSAMAHTQNRRMVSSEAADDCDRHPGGI